MAVPLKVVQFWDRPAHQLIRSGISPSPAHRSLPSAHLRRLDKALPHRAQLHFVDL